MLRTATFIFSPSQSALRWLGYGTLGGFALALAAAFVWGESAVALVAGAAMLLFIVFVVAAAFDALALRTLPRVDIERECPRSVAVNQFTEVELQLRHGGEFTLDLFVHEAFSEPVVCRELPAQVRVPAQQEVRVRYRFKALSRGPLELGEVTVNAQSPFKFWQAIYQTGRPKTLRVYPDFSQISAYALLAVENHVSQLGIKRKPRRGEGLEFMQLREYRSGDALRQIDWKATSRRRELISREYQDERDQNIVLVVDSGRRMRAKDDTLSHFDHALNAMLLVSYIALRQGDAVSVMSFGEEHRWVAAKKGVPAMRAILNDMYDLKAQNVAPDYVAAAEKLAVLQRKRALVILITNSRDEEVDELMSAARLIRKRHLLVVANIRELVVDQVAQQPLKDLDDALLYLGMEGYREKRHDAQQRIQGAGVFSVDCLAPDLPRQVANSYLEIKRAGLL